MNLRTGVLGVSALLLLPFSLFGKCPITPNGTLLLRAPAGNLLVDTTGTDSVEIEVSNRQVVLQETCGRDVVTINATMPAAIGVPDWKIKVPKTVTLDLTTQGGSIQVADTDGKDTLLRTSGGKVTAGLLKGNVLIYANEARTGNIGGNLELRGQGGRLQVGNVGGNAEFHTTGGDIVSGVVKGHVKAETGSGSVTIRESNGDVLVTTQEGDISSDYVRGSFDGKTDSGNIRIERAGSWFQAVTGTGDIFFQLVPQTLGGDLHVNVKTGIGNITMYLPEKIAATVDAVIDRPAFNAKRIFLDFPIKAGSTLAGIPSSLAPTRLFPGGPEQERTIINGGGNTVKARASAGTITIKKLSGN